MSRGRPLAHTIFLPVAGVDEPCEDGRWRVVYRRGMMTVPVEVCAPDEETAVMRAGMKRGEMFRLEWSVFPRLAATSNWERESVERVEDAHHD